jgi:hypothetical protein
MAITEAFAGTVSVTSTEYSCPNAANYSSGSAITDDGVYQVFLDTSDMVVGDQLQIRVYEKVRSTDSQRTIYEAILTGTMTDSWVSPSLILLHGWDVTILQLEGTAGITVNWSIRKVA